MKNKVTLFFGGIATAFSFIFVFLFKKEQSNKKTYTDTTAAIEKKEALEEAIEKKNSIDLVCESPRASEHKRRTEELTDEFKHRVQSRIDTLKP